MLHCRNLKIHKVLPIPLMIVTLTTAITIIKQCSKKTSTRTHPDCAIVASFENMTMSSMPQDTRVSPVATTSWTWLLWPLPGTISFSPLAAFHRPYQPVLRRKLRTLVTNNTRKVPMAYIWWSYTQTYHRHFVRCTLLATRSKLRHHLYRI